MNAVESSAEKLWTLWMNPKRSAGHAENAKVFLRFSAGKPAVSNWEELLYFRDLCSVSAFFPHGSTANTTKEKKTQVLKEETWN